MYEFILSKREIPWWLNTWRFWDGPAKKSDRDYFKGRVFHTRQEIANSEWIIRDEESVEKKRSCQCCHQFWYGTVIAVSICKSYIIFPRPACSLRIYEAVSFTIQYHRLLSKFFLHKFTQMHWAWKNCHYSVNIRGCLLSTLSLIKRLFQKVHGIVQQKIRDPLDLKGIIIYE